MVTSELEMEAAYHFAVNWPLLLLILFSAFASKVLRTLSPGICQWVCSKQSMHKLVHYYECFFSLIHGAD